MQELIEMKFGPFQIQSHLARGGMANVYLARHVETEQLVAVKLVHTSAGNYYERFRREILEVSRLHHDHILPSLAYGEYDSWCYLVTPYIGNGTLSNLLARGPLSPQDAGILCAQLASALHYAHEQGIVHRDIKSSNVLMRNDHYAYLADFGLVKRLGLDTNLTLSGYLIGTPEYMAPELADEDASPRSDIYALGILLYQMLTGRVPFKGNSPVSIYLKQIREQPLRPSFLNPKIPFEIEEVILHALAKNPRKRYQTAQELNAAYQHALLQAQSRRKTAAEVSTYMSGDTLPMPQVRVIKTDSLCFPAPLQKDAVRAPLLRKQRLRFTALATMTILLLPALFVLTENRTPSTSLAKPAIQTLQHIESPISTSTAIYPSHPTTSIPIATSIPTQIGPTNNQPLFSVPTTIPQSGRNNDEKYEKGKGHEKHR